MKRQRLSVTTRLVWIVLVAGLSTACAPVRDHDRSYHHRSTGVVYLDYWYYPAVASYYDPRARIYIYFESGHWVRARALPAHLRPRLGKHVVVRSPHDRPYERYQRHRKLYDARKYTPERDSRPAPDRRRYDTRPDTSGRSTLRHESDDRRATNDARQRTDREVGRSLRGHSSPDRTRSRAPDDRDSRSTRKERTESAAGQRRVTDDRQSVGQRTEKRADRQSRGRRESSPVPARRTNDRRSDDRFGDNADRRPPDGRRRPSRDDGAT